MRDTAGREVEGVYRIDTDGQITRIITHEVDRPNGLVVTPDDRFLYVADNNNSAGGARKLYRFALQPNGSVDATSQTLIYDWGTTRGPDGMKLDEAGRLYVAAGRNEARLPDETADPATAGIYVFSPQGKLIEFVPIPRDETTNCGFGGRDRKTLYITAGGSLWSIRPLFPASSYELTMEPIHSQTTWIDHVETFSIQLTTFDEATCCRPSSGRRPRCHTRHNRRDARVRFRLACI